MNSFLITFKPSKENPQRGWPVEELQRLVRRHHAGERVVEEWRFHNRKDVSLGKRADQQHETLSKFLAPDLLLNAEVKEP
jgi:hypothetical protein